VLIRCAGKVLVPLASVKWCEDNGDAIVVFVGDRDRFVCSGADARALRALVLEEPKERAQPAKEQGHVRKQEEGHEVHEVVPPFPRRKVGR
jgi:enoyl-CoA hydratase/carnithine racemase